MSAETVAHLWQTATEHHAVVGIDNAVVVNIFIEAVANNSAWLRSVVVKVGLCTSDTLVNPTVELTYLLAYECSIVACDV